MDDLRVMYGTREVGRMRRVSGRCAFAYSKDWVSNGFSISPRSLPLENKVFDVKQNQFDGLFGVFADSLPDGWGTYTAIRTMAKRGVSYLDLNPLEKLSLVGDDGLGALYYLPSGSRDEHPVQRDVDTVYKECLSVLENDRKADMDDLFLRAGSTGGDRPKVNHVFDNEEWIVKFKERRDPECSGRMEYEYNQAAKACGITVPDSRLIPSELCEGFFASKRFDRFKGKRIHMITLGGLLEIPHNLPLLDYHAFLQATGFVTASQEEVVKAFRLACFNVIAGNMDDHSKNFAYLYSEDERRYVLSPAYDLTRTPNQKEHEMTCMGEGNPGTDDLEALAKSVNIPYRKSKEIITTVETVVNERLSEWL